MGSVKAEAGQQGWTSIAVKGEELNLSHTLPIGQSFRWIEGEEGTFTGVIGRKGYQLKHDGSLIHFKVVSQADECVGDAFEDDLDALHDYFNLKHDLSQLTQDWKSRDARFDAVCDYFPGARLLRQDPLECLFSFICSSNNNIARIHGMVGTLCELYGDPLRPIESDGVAKLEDGSEQLDKTARFCFPTLAQLSEAREETLRARGFGYRAKFVTGAVEVLAGKPGGGEAWLQSLRQTPYREAREALQEVPGIGPKVAACICLFSLDKYEAIPVDTHVWQFAKAHYLPKLGGKTLTPKLMTIVEDELIDRFGPFAGWAHNVLFIAELAQQKKRLPENLQTPSKRKPSPSKGKARVKKAKLEPE